jgi:hypothetical protein
MQRGQKDYSRVKVMAKGAALAAERRGGADHEWVCGGFRLDFLGRVVLWACECGPAFNRLETLTDASSRFSRWRTKQAASQWLLARQSYGSLLDCRVIHLGRLDVLAV